MDVKNLVEYCFDIQEELRDMWNGIDNFKPNYSFQRNCFFLPLYMLSFSILHDAYHIFKHNSVVR